MRYSVRTLATLLGASSISLLPLLACSSSKGTGSEDAGHFADVTNPTPDAGKDTGSEKDTGTSKDTGTTKDTGAEKDSAADAEEKDGGDHDATAKDGEADKDGATDGATHEDGSSGDAAHDGAVDGAKDGATDAHDAAVAASVQNYFMGRWDLTNAVATTGVGAIAEWPGSGVITTFTGANITAYLDDTCNTSFDDAACDTVSIEIDGAAPTAAETVSINTVSKTGNVFSLVAGANTITVSGLTTGVSHTIGIYKDTDAVYGGSYTISQAFVTAAGGSNPKASYNFTHRIEFIGDDITAGTGVLPCGTGNSMTGTTAANSIEYDSYARLVAEYFNADRHNLSGANIGVYESDPPSASGGPAEIGTLFPLVLPSEATSAWFPASAANASNPLPGYVPDLVVVNLGSEGDFSDVTGDNPVVPTGFAASYETALETFLTAVRTNYPSISATRILVTVGPGYAGAETAAEANGWVNAAVTNRQANGETASSMVFYAPDLSSGYNYAGCEYRPSVSDQVTYAAGVEGAIKTSFGWTAETWAP